MELIEIIEKRQVGTACLLAALIKAIFVFIVYFFNPTPSSLSCWVSRDLTANKPLQAWSGTQLRPPLLAYLEALWVLCSASGDIVVSAHIKTCQSKKG